MKAILACVGVLLALSASAQQTDGSGLKLAAAVDLVGDFNTASAGQASDEFGLREAEIMLYGPIDQTFDGVLSFAAHREGAAAFLETHEAYISSSKLLPRSRVKLGQFFLGVGRLNRAHRHDWPFISAPLVHDAFFDYEAVADAGIEYGYVLPLPFFLDLSLGYTSGYTFGHTHDAGKKPRRGTHYVHLSSFATLPADLQLLYGASFLGRTDHAGVATTLTGINTTLKKREGKTIRYLVESELWRRSRQPSSGLTTTEFGGYVFPEYGFEGGLSFGVRCDYLTNNTLTDAFGKKVANHQDAVVPTLTYRNSEFSRFRLGYEKTRQLIAGQKTTTSDKVEMQITFILGAHPAHDF